MISPRLPRVAIMYGSGTASAWQIRCDLRGQFEPVFVLPSHLPAPRRPHAHQMVPWAGLTSTAQALRQLRIDGIVTFSDDLLTATSQLARLLGLPGNSQRSAHLLTHKAAQRRCFAAQPRIHVRHRVVWSEASFMRALDEVGFPAVLKPSRGHGSTDVYPVPTRRAALALRERMRRLFDHVMILEEYLSDGQGAGPLADYVSVETLSSKGRRQHLGLLRKLPTVEPFRETAHVMMREAVGRFSEILKVVETCLDAAEVVSGLTHTEIKLTPEGPRPIEVNGRLGGFVREVLRPATGVSPILQVALTAVGETPPPTSYPDGVKPGVHFAFTGLAPPGNVRLLAARGHAEIRGMREVTEARVVSALPREFDSSTSTAELDVVAGSCVSLPHMERILRGLLPRLSYCFGLPDGRQTVMTGDRLPSFRAVQKAFRPPYRVPANNRSGEPNARM